MPEKAVYMLVFEGYADWEPSHAIAELRRHGQYRVECAGLTLGPIGSMGGITVLPSKAVSDVDPADVAVFILPGGDRWESGPLEASSRRCGGMTASGNGPKCGPCLLPPTSCLLI
jgi:putative intracellular protease/amidase